MRTVDRYSLFAGSLALGLLAQPLIPSPSLAQEKDAPAQAGLQCFDQMQRLDQRICSSLKGEVVMAVVLEWRRYRPVVVDSILDGLERLALTSDNQRVRIAAAIWLGTPGEMDPPRPGIVDRLSRVYRTCDDQAVRRALVGPAFSQRDTAAALQFLEMVARDDRPEDRGSDEPPARGAVQYLARLGPRGRAVLERLQREGGVKNPVARANLNYLAKGDFQPR